MWNGWRFDLTVFAITVLLGGLALWSIMGCAGTTDAYCPARTLVMQPAGDLLCECDLDVEPRCDCWEVE